MYSIFSVSSMILTIIWLMNIRIKLRLARKINWQLLTHQLVIFLSLDTRLKDLTDTFIEQS